MTLNSTCKADGTWTSSASICPTGPPGTHSFSCNHIDLFYLLLWNKAPKLDQRNLSRLVGHYLSNTIEKRQTYINRS